MKPSNRVRTMSILPAANEQSYYSFHDERFSFRAVFATAQVEKPESLKRKLSELEVDTRNGDQELPVGPPTCSFVCQGPSKPGKVDIAKLKALGAKPGPFVKKLKEGESVTLPNGMVIHPHQCVEPNKPGHVSSHVFFSKLKF